jgi:hypothetical protein
VIRPLLRSVGTIAFSVAAAVLLILVAVAAAAGVIGCGCYLAVFGSRRRLASRLLAGAFDRVSNRT